ncbi:hypothetical protein [Clostridium hydrogeniformans]|uniref:hypothetical protein n=1 Tax=Clostridium hydrogeniformans TaxID=349933 RepID=UPI00055852CF|nr:hypothetical protein [Clostridium hydrogeniformans]
MSLWFITLRSKGVIKINQCPFLSTSKESITCFNSCPFRKDDDECPFKVFANGESFKFKDNLELDIDNIYENYQGITW